MYIYIHLQKVLEMMSYNLEAILYTLNFTVKYLSNFILWHAHL